MIKGIIIDLDGTVYRGNQVIQNVPETIIKLRKAGLKIFFLSNASMKTRKEQAEKLKGMGIACEISEMYNSAYATASYIKKYYYEKSIYVISEGGLQQELEAKGLRLEDGENAGIVAVGLDTKLTFEKLVTGLRAIRKGALFIASNVDRIYPTEKGILPGSGTVAAFLEYGTGKKPIVIGKPELHLIEAVLEENKLKNSEVLIVGDNYETDILVAKKAKMASVLVLTGITKRKDIEKLPKAKQPDYIIDNLTEVLGIITSH